MINEDYCKKTDQKPL